MSEKHINHHLINKSLEAATENMAPLEEYKSPATAAIFGLILGAIGVGIYFKSWKDFGTLSVIWIFCLIFAVPTAGAAALLGPILSAVYGYRRAHASNLLLMAGK